MDLNLNCRMSPENETIFPGFIPGKYIVKDIPLKLPKDITNTKFLEWQTEYRKKGFWKDLTSMNTDDLIKFLFDDEFIETKYYQEAIKLLPKDSIYVDTIFDF